MNLDDLINRAIEVAQSSAASRRDAALQVAKLNSDTQLSLADKNAETYRSHDKASLKNTQLSTEATKYNADQVLRAQQTHADAQVYSADRNLLGQVVGAGAQAKRADVEAAMPNLRAQASLLGGIVTPGPTATKAEISAANTKNAASYSAIESLRGDPTLNDALTKFDPAATAGSFLRGAPSQGITFRSAPTQSYGAPSQPAAPLATNRTPSSIGGGVGFQQSRPMTPTLTQPQQPRLMDPSRLGGW